MKLIVFNAKREELREILIVPDFEWGGEGCLGCDVGSGMVHWIPKKGAAPSVSSPVNQHPMPQSPQSPQQPQVQQVTSPLTPPLQAQFQQMLASQPSSITESPAKAQQVPQVNVNVNVPSARPVVNLSSDSSQQQQQMQQGVSQAIFPESVPAPALAPPPMTSYHHHPHSQQHQQHQQPAHPQTTNSPAPVIDDIPMPNFSVPSDIINQK